MLDREKGARSVANFCAWADISKTLFYEEVKAGRLKTRKICSKTIVTDEDGRAWLASLPEDRPRDRSAGKAEAA